MNFSELNDPYADYMIFPAFSVCHELEALKQQCYNEKIAMTTF